MEHLDLTNFRRNYQNVRYIEVKLIIILQNPAFPHMNNYCNKICSLTPISLYQAVYSYLCPCIYPFYPCWSVWLSYRLSHVDS